MCFFVKELNFFSKGFLLTLVPYEECRRCGPLVRDQVLQQNSYKIILEEIIYNILNNNIRLFCE